MKKFVLSSNQQTLRLNEKHLDWLHTNGYPDADERFCNDDRSNPILIACIEAVHNSMNPLIEYAYELMDKADTIKAVAEVDREKISNALDAFLKAIHACGVKYHNNSIINVLQRPKTERMSWENACPYFNRRFGIPVDNAKDAYEEYLECLNSPVVLAMQEAYSELEAFCEANGLQRKFQKIEINDGYVVTTFDETRFTAKVISNSNEEQEGSNPSYWETMELTPFITRNIIYSYVTTGDTDGLMEYLRSLNSNILIDG